MALRQTILLTAMLLASFAAPPALRAADVWCDARFQFRRSVDVDWDWQHPTGREIAAINFSTAGHPPQSNCFLVATSAGVPVPSRLLMTGPGDSVRLAFALSPGIQHYDVYFANTDNAAATLPDAVSEMKITSGMLVETRKWTGTKSDSIAAILAGSEKSGPLIGRAVIDRPYLAGSPFGNQKPAVTKFTGQFNAPEDSRYLFAASIGSHGALLIDDQPTLFVPMPTNQAGYQAWVPLTKGAHTMTIYQVYDRQPPALAVGWERHGVAPFQILGRDVFGVVSHGQCGALQSRDGKFAADFLCEYLGECSLGEQFSHRCRFIAALPPTDQSNGQPIDVRWTFGDGLSGDGAAAEHVFFGSGVYPVTMTISAGPIHQSATVNVSVDRDWEHLSSLQVDAPKVQADIAARYNVAEINLANLPIAALLMAQAQNPSAALAAANRLASAKSHPTRSPPLMAMEQITQSLLSGPQSEKALDIWNQIPADSDLNPYAAVYHAQLCLWWTGEFDKALQFLQPLSEKFPNDRALQCAFAQALLLDNHADKAKEILAGLPIREAVAQRAAIVGALARTVEYYVDQKDSQQAQDAWDKWAIRFPASFLEGYSVLLRARIMAQQGRAAPAAKLAEAFVNAQPQSAYCPQLLEFAAAAVQDTDPAKARQLLQTLKDKFPEEPIAH